MAEAIKQVNLQKPARNFFKLTNSRRETWAALGFLAPNLLAFLVFTLGPAIFSIISSA